MSEPWLKVNAPRPVTVVKMVKLASLPRLLAGLIERLHTIGPVTHRQNDCFGVNMAMGRSYGLVPWKWLVWSNGWVLLLAPWLSKTLDDCVSQGYAERTTVADVEHRDVYTWSITPKGTEVAEIMLKGDGPESAIGTWSVKFFGDWEGFPDRRTAENAVNPRT